MSVFRFIYSIIIIATKVKPIACASNVHQYELITDLQKNSQNKIRVRATKKKKVKKPTTPPKASKMTKEMKIGKDGKAKVQNESYTPTSSAVDRVFPTIPSGLDLQGSKGKGKKSGISPSPDMSPSTKGKTKGKKSKFKSKSPSIMPASTLVTKGNLQAPSMAPSKASHETISPTTKRTKGKGKDNKKQKKAGTAFKGSAMNSSIPTSLPVSMPIESKGKGNKKKDSNNKNGKAKQGTRGPSNAPSFSPKMIHSKSPTRISKMTLYPTRYKVDLSVNPSSIQSLPPSYLSLAKFTPRPSPSSPRPTRDLTTSPSSSSSAKLTSSTSSPRPTRELSVSPFSLPSAKPTSSTSSPLPSLKPTQELSTTPLQIPSMSPTYDTVEDTTIPNSSTDIDGRESNSSGSLILFATASSVLVLGLLALKKARTLRRNAIESSPDREFNFPVNLDDVSEAM